MYEENPQHIFYSVYSILLFYALLYMRIERANLTRFSEVFYEGRSRVFWELTNFPPFFLLSDVSSEPEFF